MGDIVTALRRRALEWAPRIQDGDELGAIARKLAAEYISAADEIERLRATVQGTLARAIAADKDAWDGEWLVESDILDDDIRISYKVLVEGLRYADPEQIPLITREIFQMGYYQGITL